MTIIPKGTKIVIGVDAGFAGSDSMQAYVLTQDYTDDQLARIAWEDAVQWAESYGVYPYPDSLEEEEEDEGYDYSDNIEGWWDFYDEQTHAGHCMYGDQRAVHFNPL